MTDKELEVVLQQFLDDKAGTLIPHSIPLTPAMIERLEVHAEEMGITVEQAASFILWGKLLETERKAHILNNQIKN